AAGVAGARVFADDAPSARVGLSAYDKLVLADDPVAYWRMSHPSHGEEEDRTGNGHTGTYHNVTEAVQLPNGDGAAVFNGSSGYFQVPDSDAFHISTTGKFTVEAWISPHTLQFPNDEAGGYVHFMGKGLKSGSDGDREWGGRMYSKVNDEDRPNRVSGYAWNLDGGKGAGAYFEEPVEVGEFIHYAIAFDTSEGEYGKVWAYRNGVLTNTQDLVYRPGTDEEVVVVPEPGPAPVRLGSRDGQSYFEGVIAKFAIYDRKLAGRDLLPHYEKMTA
ncbi:MAG: LamG-like jellyroll fold domain-containing protein, partial [Stackebrandtia sp.]